MASRQLAFPAGSPNLDAVDHHRNPQSAERKCEPVHGKTLGLAETAFFAMQFTIGYSRGKRRFATLTAPPFVNVLGNRNPRCSVPCPALMALSGLYEERELENTTNEYQAAHIGEIGMVIDEQGQHPANAMAAGSVRSMERRHRDAKTFVLVHGAWHGAWCWSRVASRLRARGHTVLVPTLTGLGEHVHHLSGSINLSTHIQDVVSLIDVESLDNVVLCGHSYGGMVITGVADQRPAAVGALVYLDAFVPENGQSVFDHTRADFVATQLGRAADNDGFSIPPPPAAIFGVKQEDQPWVNAKCSPQPLATFCERIRLTGMSSKIARKTYILATGWHDSPFTGFYEALAVDPSWNTIDVDAGHDVMIDVPDRLAELLEYKC
ncbi:alpha/beta fold hydrolase [Paraburkholderia sp. CI3]|uniref:alpha/beta hydrolase n=1 Tax=Paraburkholderia sp. CI3 TaxID=2991060 RepID=UPI003D25797C